MKEKTVKKGGLTWNQKFYIVATIVIVVTLSFCFTMAYYFDSKRSESNLSIGSIEIDKEGSFFGEGELISDAIPGDDMFGEISFNKVERSSPMFIRAKVHFHIEEYNYDTPEYIAHIDNWLSMLNGSEVNLTTMSLEGEYKWMYAQAEDEEEGYYYLIREIDLEGPTAYMYQVSTTDKIYLTQGLKMPTIIDQIYVENGDVFTYQQPIYITVEIQAMQAEHLYNINANRPTVQSLMPVFHESFNR